MKLIIEYFDLEINTQEIINFFNLFSDTSDNLIIYKLEIPNSDSNKRKKIDKKSFILEHIIKKIEEGKSNSNIKSLDINDSNINYSNIKSLNINDLNINALDINDPNIKFDKSSSVKSLLVKSLSIDTYTIYITKSSIKSIFGEDSGSDLINLLYKHIAYHFGYSRCKCSGFTVKDKDNKKIQVEEIVYINNEYKFYVPDNLIFVKTDKKVKSPVSTNYLYNTDFKTKSLILYSILSCKEVHFKCGDISYHLKRNDNTYVIYCDIQRPSIYNLINLSKENQVSEYLKKNPKEISRFLYKIYSEKDLSVLEPVSKFKKMVEKDSEYVWSFLCVVPLFYDNRDFITEKISEIYESIDHNKQVKKKGDYLDIKERRYIDRMGYSSLKRYFYEVNDSI